MKPLLLAAALLLTLPSPLEARQEAKAVGVPRDANGRIARSQAAVKAFRRLNPCPSTGERYGRCPNHIIDHVRALACGGPDTPANMQWQTIEEAKAKDKWERKGC